MARTANTWGTIRTKSYRTKKGTSTFYKASYPNPVKTPGHEISRSFHTRRQAAAWLENEKRLVDAYHRGEIDWTTPKQRKAKRLAAEQKKELTFGEYAINFVRNYRKPDGSPLENGTRRQKEIALRHLLDGNLSNMSLAEIKEQDVQRWLDDHSNIGQHALKRGYQLCKAIMRKAVQTGLIARNPVTMTPPKLPPSRQAQIPTATPHELKEIADAMPERVRISVYLAAGCGLRMGEVCALQRRDIDLRNKTLTVRHSIGRGPGDRGFLRLKAPKTMTSYRTVDIPPFLVPMIAHHLAHRPSKPDAMVIPSTHGGIIAPNSLRTTFDKARNAAGRPDIHFHTLRATYITGIIHHGATLKETMELAGHTSATVDALYQRPDQKREREAVDRYGDYLAQTRTRSQIENDIQQTKAKLARLENELGKASD